MDTCQAIEKEGSGHGAVCRKPRVESWSVKIGDVEAFVDFCAEHSRRVLETHPDITARLEGWAPSDEL